MKLSSHKAHFISGIIATILILLFGSETLLAQNLERLKEFKSLRDNKPFELSGSVGLGFSSYFSNDPMNRRTAPLNWFVSGSPVMKIYGISLPFTLIYSETGRSLTHPFVYNFYGVSPYYKWAKTHFGYRSMQFSEYTMNGMVFNGAGIELEPKKIRFAAFWGVLNPAVAEDTAEGRQGVFAPAYLRRAFGTKIGYGGKENYVDLIVFKGKDISTSLDNLPSNELIRPGENLSAGLKTRFKYFKNWFAELDGGVSLYTRNVLFDSLKDVEVLQKYQAFMLVNSTTRAYYAGHILTGCQYNKWGVNFRIREVSSDFSTMGLYFVQNDIREFTANPNFRLLKGKLSLGSSLGWYSDNISKKRAGTTIRKIMNFNSSYSFGQNWMFQASYLNFGTSRTAGLVQQNDSITFSLINQAINGSVSYTKNNDRYTHFVSLFTTYQKADDRNQFTGNFNQSATTSITSNYNISEKKHGMTLGLGVHYTGFEVMGISNDIIGSSLNAHRKWWDNKLSTGISASLSNRYSDGQKQGLVFSSSLNASMDLNKKHQVQLLANLLRNSTGIVSNHLLSEQRISMRYNYVFR